MTRIKHLNVNGARREVDADPERSLLNVLRDDLELTGAKYGCGEGQCGACTVLVDGQARRSCVTAVGRIGESRITTIEGVASEGRLAPLQQAFLEENALQCGYCTPGMILSALALLRENTAPTEAEVIRAMDGNICRCGVYPRILSAIRRATALAEGGEQ